MVDSTLVVAIDARVDGLEVSLKRVTQKLSEMELSAKNTGVAVATSVRGMESSLTSLNAIVSRTVASFGLLVAGLLSISTAKTAVLAVDDLNASLTRLRVLTNSSAGSAGDTFRQIADSASRVGQPLQAATDQFQRFYTATAQLGASRQQVQQFVTVLGQFSQISGQKPQEAAAAITQLAQGLASGRLAGDELRSILENMPQLATALARELGVSVGQLREMGTEGRLTAENVFPALLRAGQNMATMLENVPLTVRQAWQTALDGMGLAIQALDQQIGGTTWIARLLTNLGEIGRLAGQQLAGRGANPSPDDEVAVLSQQAGDLQRAILARTQLLREREADGYRISERERQRIAADNAADEASFQQKTTRIGVLQGLQRATTRDETDARARQGEDLRVSLAETEARVRYEAANPLAKVERENQEAITRIRAEFTDRRAQLARQGDEAQATGGPELERRQLEALTTQREVYNRAVEGTRAASNAAATADAAALQAAVRALERVRQEQNQLTESIARPGDRGIAGMARQFDTWNAATETATSAYGTFIEQIRGGNESVTTLFTAVGREAEKAGIAMVRAGDNPRAAISRLAEETTKLRDRLIGAGVAAPQIDAAIAQATREAQRAIDAAVYSAGAGGRSDARAAEVEARRQQRARDELAQAKIRQSDEIARAGDRGLGGMNRQFAQWNVNEDTNGEAVGSAWDNFVGRVVGGQEQMVTGFIAVQREGERAAQSLVRSAESPQPALDATNEQLTILRDRLIAAGVSAPQVQQAFETATAGTERAFERMADRAGQTWNDIGVQGVKTLSSDLGGALVDFANTGVDSFEKMATSFAMNVTKMIINFMILKAITAGLRGLDTGWSNTLADGLMPRRAEGGHVSAGQSYIVGERRPEVFTPGASGFITPRVPEGTGGGTNVVVNNYSRAQIETSSSPNGQGGQDLQIMITEAVNQGLNTGQFDRSLGATFGVRRVGRN